MTVGQDYLCIQDGMIPKFEDRVRPINMTHADIKQANVVLVEKSQPGYEDLSMTIERMDIKTHVVRYECGECHSYFTTEEEAAECEESHGEEEHTH